MIVLLIFFLVAEILRVLGRSDKYSWGTAVLLVLPSHSIIGIVLQQFLCSASVQMFDWKMLYIKVVRDLRYWRQLRKLPPGPYPPIKAPNPDHLQNHIIFAEFSLHVAMFLLPICTVNCYFLPRGDLARSVVYGTEAVLGVAHITVTALTFYAGSHTSLRTPLYRLVQFMGYVIVVDQGNTE